MDTTYFAQQAIVSMMVHLVFFAVTFWALLALNLEKLLKKNRVVQARLLYVLLTISIGSLVSSFFLDYLSWSQSLVHLLP
ncbi:membrane protein [Bacillus coahuilensis p1.1.43]|uniref:Membrane protein n=1 Tax=Bacillus coahuilensis p1.1.43 TaxID=1150625 RepID=A0A147K497_9BACI|nr:DUF1146 family protein [Bacillus coahuilensis]KUP04145.1 membrane protein [Bacillus coahuilensis p1.1.43]